MSVAMKRRTRTAVLSLALVAGLLGTACVPAAGGGTPVMQAAKVTPGQMAAWFHTKGSPGTATVPVEWLAYFFVTEGRAEGVAGDLAFVQAMVETGWLRFSARMPRDANNFSGIGAVDGGTGAAWFPSAQIGVRAQIQHLRAYADAGVHTGVLANPLADPRFDLVAKGSAPPLGELRSGRVGHRPRIQRQDRAPVRRAAGLRRRPPRPLTPASLRNVPALIAIVASVVEVVGLVLLAVIALARGAMSVVAPVSALTAAVVPVVAGIGMGDRPSAWQWIGVLVALPAILLISRAVGPPSGQGRGPGEGPTGVAADRHHQFRAVEIYENRDGHGTEHGLGNGVRRGR